MILNSRYRNSPSSNTFPSDKVLLFFCSSLHSRWLILNHNREGDVEASEEEEDEAAEVMEAGAEAEVVEEPAERTKKRPHGFP